MKRVANVSQERSVGGGGTGNPNSLANLRNAPAAPAGNTRAVRHGGYATVAAERLDAKVAEVYAALTEDAPLRDADGGLPRADTVAVRLLAEALCRLDDVGRWLDDYGKRDAETGDARRSIIELESKLRREAADYREALGMTPRSRVKLGLDLARGADFATAMSHPDPAERERLLEAAGLDEEDDE